MSSAGQTDAQLARMGESELEAWSDSPGHRAVEPKVGAEPAPPAPLVSTTVRMPRDLLGELKAEAARHRQPYQRYVKDLLLALRQVQSGRSHRPAQLRLTDEQLHGLTEHGELTLRVRRIGS